jgi:hypothetical protein
MSHALPLTALSPEVLRPPLYDQYVFDNGLCASWATLRLGRRLPERDVIQLTVELDAVPQDEVEFVLTAGPAVSFWKGIRLPDGTLLETENDARRSDARGPVEQVHSSAVPLLLHKALRSLWFNLAVVRRIVYRVGDLSWIPGGSRLTFALDDDAGSVSLRP